MLSKISKLLVLTVVVFMVASVAHAQKPLAGVKTVQVDPTVVPKAEAVKEEHAPNQVADSLRNALRNANFEIGVRVAVARGADGASLNPARAFEHPHHREALCALGSLETGTA